ncbi:CsiV family protein [Spongiibacter tropicus]|uniref:CsiV family protein n=1 Tax=Spongiibacter tropicus TaxID=454602 RepID=UPI0035BE485B
MHRQRFFALLFATLLSAGALAQPDGRYQIDLVVYANTDPAAQQAEVWPDNLHLRYPHDWVRLNNQGEANLSRVGTNHPQFAKALRSLKLSSRYRILTQLSWIQDLEPRKRAPAVLIQGGERYGEHYELEGYIRIALERYLYAEPQLWLSRFGYQQGNYYLPRRPNRHQPIDEEVEIPQEDTLPPQEALVEFPGTDMSIEDNAPSQPVIPVGAEPVERIVVMSEERRMRSDELHYIDNPLFGLLIMISKPQTSTVAEDTLSQQ